MESSGPPWPCLAAHPEGVTLSLKVAPNASKTRAEGLWRERLKLRVQAPPVEGKANKIIRQWVAQEFGIRANQVEILKGEKSGQKVVLIRGVSLAAATEVLNRMGATPA